MKKVLASLICLMALGLTSRFAESSEKHAVEFGTEISHITYREPGVMRESGVMYGLTASYAYRGLLAPSPKDIGKLMLKIEGKGSWGLVDYRNSGTTDNISDYMLEFRGFGGYALSVSKAITLTPYFGVGYRYLIDDMAGKISSTGAAGYERESNYLYSPLGLEAVADLGGSWYVGVTAEYDIFWWGRQISHRSNVNAGYNDWKNDQHEGYGIRGSVKIQKKYQTVYFTAEPFVRYWNIKRSENADWTFRGTRIGYGYEPKNHSTEIGLGLTVKF